MAPQWIWRCYQEPRTCCWQQTTGLTTFPPTPQHSLGVTWCGATWVLPALRSYSSVRESYIYTVYQEHQMGFSLDPHWRPLGLKPVKVLTYIFFGNKAQNRSYDNVDEYLVTKTHQSNFPHDNEINSPTFVANLLCFVKNINAAKSTMIFHEFLLFLADRHGTIIVWSYVWLTQRFNGT